MRDDFQIKRLDIGYGYISYEDGRLRVLLCRHIIYEMASLSLRKKIALAISFSIPQHTASSYFGCGIASLLGLVYYLLYFILTQRHHFFGGNDMVK